MSCLFNNCRLFICRFHCLDLRQTLDPMRGEIRRYTSIDFEPLFLVAYPHGNSLHCSIRQLHHWLINRPKNRIPTKLDVFVLRHRFVLFDGSNSWKMQIKGYEVPIYPKHEYHSFPKLLIASQDSVDISIHLCIHICVWKTTHYTLHSNNKLMYLHRQCHKIYWMIEKYL